MSTGAVIGTSLPKIAPPSTPIHMAALSTVRHDKSPTVAKLIDSTNISRNKSAPAKSSKTFVTSADYGAHTQYRNAPGYEVYPPFVTERQTGTRVPPRVNPLQPPPPQRLTTSLETIEPHWHNEKRRNVMQQREWYRYHGTWSKAFYGSPAEKEAYRKRTRDTLKQQMSDFWADKRRGWQEGSKESQVSIAYDNDCMMQDSIDHKNKTIYLMQYRDDNKSLMEKGWARQAERLRQEQTFENEALRYTPINWSHTLK
ncbi:uncharacterized protein [Watersipora subatra]